MVEFYAALKSLWVVWLMGIFLAIAVWAYWPANKRRLQEHGRIPLDDDEADAMHAAALPANVKRKG